MRISPHLPRASLAAAAGPLAKGPDPGLPPCGGSICAPLSGPPQLSCHPVTSALGEILSVLKPLGGLSFPARRRGGEAWRGPAAG